jgi:hypothetical protein
VRGVGGGPFFYKFFRPGGVRLGREDAASQSRSRIIFVEPVRFGADAAPTIMFNLEHYMKLFFFGSVL